MARARSPSWARGTYVASGMAFAGTLAALVMQMQSGSDPALGAVAPAPKRPYLVVTKKIIRTTVVTKRIVRPAPVVVAAPTGVAQQAPPVQSQPVQQAAPVVQTAAPVSKPVPQAKPAAPAPPSTRAS